MFYFQYIKTRDSRSSQLLIFSLEEIICKPPMKILLLLIRNNIHPKERHLCRCFLNIGACLKGASSSSAIEVWCATRIISNPFGIALRWRHKKDVDGRVCSYRSITWKTMQWNWGLFLSTSLIWMFANFFCNINMH